MFYYRHDISSDQRIELIDLLNKNMKHVDNYLSFSEKT